MRSTRRWRTVVKWGLLAGAVGVAVLFTASLRWYAIWNYFYPPRAVSLLIANGRVSFEWGRPTFNYGGPIGPPGLTIERSVAAYGTSSGPIWKPFVALDGFWHYIELPLWIPFVLALGAYGFLHFAQSGRAKDLAKGACASCGYNRAGLVAGAACPECGALPKGAAADSGTS